MANGIVEDAAQPGLQRAGVVLLRAEEAGHGGLHAAITLLRASNMQPAVRGPQRPL